MNYTQFAQRIKNKYPQYKDIDDLELANKVISKYPQYQQVVEFDTTPIEQPPLEQTPIEQTPQEQYIQDVGGQPDFTQLQPATAKELALGAAKVAPYASLAFPGTYAGIAAGAGLTGGARVLQGILEGETGQEAAASGLTAAATEGVLGGGIKAVTKPALKLLSKFATKADKKIVDVAIKDSPLTKVETTTNADKLFDLNDLLFRAQTKNSQVFNSAIKKLKPKTEKKVITEGLQKLTKGDDAVDFDATKELLIGTGPKTKDSTQLQIALDTFFGGLDLTFDQAKRVNSSLSSAMRNTSLTPLEKRDLSNIKDVLEKGLKNSYPELLKANKEYAKNIDLINRLKKIKTESTMQSLQDDYIKKLKKPGRQTKESLFKDIEKLDKYTGRTGYTTSLSKQIKASAIQEDLKKSIEKKGSAITNLLTGGGIVGAGVVDPVLGGTLLASQLGKAALQTEPVATKLLTKAQQAQRPGGTDIGMLSKLLSKQAGIQMAKPEEEKAPKTRQELMQQRRQRQNDGQLQLRTLQEIKRERGL